MECMEIYIDIPQLASLTGMNVREKENERDDTACDFEGLLLTG